MRKLILIITLNLFIVPALIAQDSDDDGMSDNWENVHSLNSMDPKDAWLDNDSDNVINLFEYQLDTDPNSSSTPLVINAAIGLNIGSVIGNSTSGILIRFESGTHIFNYNGYFSKHVMLQGGWDHSFNSRNPYGTPTILNGQSAAELVNISWIDGEGCFILDGVHLLNGGGTNGSLKFIMKQAANGTLSLKDCVIKNSISATTISSAVNSFSWDSSSCNTYIINTLISECSSTAVQCYATETSRSKVRLINNTITNNNDLSRKCYGFSGFTLNNASLDLKMINQIIYGNKNEAIDISATNGTIDFTSANCDFDNTKIDSSVNYTSISDINTNPQFTLPGTDYHLMQGSPCVDAGVDVGLPFAGNAPDLGYYENGLNIGIHEVELSNEVVFPNPIISSKLYFKIPFSLCKIISSEGQTVFEKHDSSTQQTLDISFLRDGIYYLCLNSEKLNKNIKFIKLH
jgi:hypothetical protein